MVLKLRPLMLLMIISKKPNLRTVSEGQLKVKLSIRIDLQIFKIKASLNPWERNPSPRRNISQKRARRLHRSQWWKIASRTILRVTITRWYVTEMVEGSQVQIALLKLSAKLMGKVVAQNAWTSQKSADQEEVPGYCRKDIQSLAINCPK